MLADWTLTIPGWVVPVMVMGAGVGVFVYAIVVFGEDVDKDKPLVLGFISGIVLTAGIAWLW